MLPPKKKNTLVTGSRVAACEKATSVNEAGSGLDATSAANVRLWTSLKACKESCHRSSTNLQIPYERYHGLKYARNDKKIMM